MAATNFILVVFQLILFSRKAELQAPTITPAFSSPLTVVESESVTLEWTYNLHGVDFTQMVFSIQGGAFVVQKFQTNAPFIAAIFRGRVESNITERFASIKFLSMNRTDSRTYKLSVVNANGEQTADTVEIQVPFKPENVQLSTNATGNQACRGNFLNFICLVGSANPQVTSYQLFENDIVVDTSNSGMWSRIMSSSGVFTYKCLANNTAGTANSTSVKITSGGVSTIQPLENETIHEGDNLNLSCNASGTPSPFVSWVWISTGQRFNGSVLELTNINRNQAGDYRCEASNDCGNELKTAAVHVTFKPNVTIQQCPTPVTEGDNTTLYCNAAGYPVPNIAWINESSGNVESANNTLPITTITRSQSGNYTCHASNEIGNGTQTCEINVYYPPIIIKPSENETEEVYQSDVVCQAEGNPLPTYVWKNASGEVIADKSTFKAAKGGNFTCYATNNIATVFRSIFITITYYEIFVEMTLLVDDISQPAQDLTNKVVNEIDERYVNVPNYNRTEVIGYTLVTGTSHSLELSKGRVKVYIVVYLNNPVTTDEGLANLQSAVASGKLGEFEVSGPLKIIDRPATTPVVSTVESTAATAATSTTSSQKDGPPWPIIGGVIGAVVVVIIIIIVVAWWVQNRRKCRRKDTKIHNSESEVLQGQNDIEDGVHAQVNGGYGGRYADSGPPSANGTNQFVQPQPEQQQQQAAVTPPDYAVVDKSKKKNRDNNNGKENIPDYAVVDKSKKKKNKKAEAEDPYAEVEDRKKDKDKKTADPSTHDYAVVNKSKKKKKEEDENAYATVDKSKKSKKQKPKAPGEVLYADLDDFKPVQAPSMPTVSTSPEPLAPLKRPPSYQGTEYADITQFLTGNATLPEGQSTEMQPTYANAGGGQGAAANKENANTGGKGGGGGDAEPKETPM